MFNYKPVLAAAVIALAAPLATTFPSFAQGTKAQGSHGGGGGHMSRGSGGGGGHMSRGGGGGGRHMGGGGGGRHMAGGGGWQGGGHHGGGWRGGHRGGFYPGFVAGTAIGIGSAFADPYYYDDGAYGYYDDGPAVEAVPSGGDDVAYCQQRFQSYDISSGTYLGYDGMRHPCP
ncbi:MAG: BA14K family protein [Nitrobacter sp.]